MDRKEIGWRQIMNTFAGLSDYWNAPLHGD